MSDYVEAKRAELADKILFLIGTKEVENGRRS